MIVIITQLYQLFSQRANEKRPHCYSTNECEVHCLSRNIHIHALLNTDTERKHKHITYHRFVDILYLDQAASLIMIISKLFKISSQNCAHPHNEYKQSSKVFHSLAHEIYFTLPVDAFKNVQSIP